MRVTRRRVMWIVGAAVGVAGCVDRDGNGNEDGATELDDPDENESEESDPVEAGPEEDKPEGGDPGEEERYVNESEEDTTGGDANEESEGVGRVSFEVLEVESGTSEESASVRFEDGVLVEGTIGGENSCYTARLADVSLSGDDLIVAVESYEDADEGQMCAQALVGIEYEARIELVNAAPGTVVVEHDGSPVTTEER